jgi:hypothetical protein
LSHRPWRSGVAALAVHLDPAVTQHVRDCLDTAGHQQLTCRRRSAFPCSADVHCVRGSGGGDPHCFRPWRRVCRCRRVAPKVSWDHRQQAGTAMCQGDRRVDTAEAAAAPDCRVASHAEEHSSREA